MHFHCLLLINCVERRIGFMPTVLGKGNEMIHYENPLVCCLFANYIVFFFRFGERSTMICGKSCDFVPTFRIFCNPNFLSVTVHKGLFNDVITFGGIQTSSLPLVILSSIGYPPPLCTSKWRENFIRDKTACAGSLGIISFQFRCSFYVLV